MYAQDQVNMAGAGMGAIAGSGIGLGTIQTMSAEATRRPEVVAEMERLEKAVETLHKTAEVLADRLDCVRNQCSNSAIAKDTSAPEPVLCGYAHAIRTQRQKVESAQAILQRAMNELEI